MDNNSNMKLCVEEAAKIVQGKHEEFPGCESVLAVDAWYLSGTYGQVVITGVSPSADTDDCSVGNYAATVKSPAAGGSTISPGSTLPGGATVRGTLMVGIYSYPAKDHAVTVYWQGLAGKFVRNGVEHDLMVSGSTYVQAGYDWGTASASTNSTLPT